MTENNIRSTETATFAGGNFWCTEAIFKRLKGVHSVMPGYAGGDTENPSYQDVSGGATGHAEAVQITYDPAVISYKKLLAVFLATHDPTTLNQQGADIGTQYRSMIFYHSNEQKKLALQSKRELEKAKKHKDPVVTEIVPYSVFYTAEEYHRNYFDNNRSYPYCRVIIDPKIQKLLKEFDTDVKDEYKR